MEAFTLSFAQFLKLLPLNYKGKMQTMIIILSIKYLHNIHRKICFLLLQVLWKILKTQLLYKIIPLNLFTLAKLWLYI